MANRSSLSATSAPSVNNRFSRKLSTRARRSTLFLASIRPVKVVAGLISAAVTLTTVTAGGGVEAAGFGCLLSPHPETSSTAQRTGAASKNDRRCMSASDRYDGSCLAANGRVVSKARHACAMLAAFSRNAREREPSSQPRQRGDGDVDRAG